MRPTTTTLAALGLATLVGCSLIQPQGAKEAAKGPGGRGKGGPADQVIAPKRCALQVAILARPLKDPALNEALWGGADEQVIPADVRRALEANGLHAAVATGNLPAATRAVLEAPAPQKVEPKVIVLPDGNSTLIELKAATPQVTLLLNRNGAVAGKDYQDASASFRLTATHAGGAGGGEAGVAVRIVPEVRHGPIRRQFDGTQNPGQFEPRQFVMKDGQEEETFRDLAVTLTLRPNQVAVIGSLPDRRRSVGDFLLTEPEPGSDRLLQKVVLIWAATGTESLPGTPSAPPAVLEPVDPAPPKP